MLEEFWLDKPLEQTNPNLCWNRQVGQHVLYHVQDWGWQQHNLWYRESLPLSCVMQQQPKWSYSHLHHLNSWSLKGWILAPPAWCKCSFSPHRRTPKFYPAKSLCWPTEASAKLYLWIGVDVEFAFDDSQVSTNVHLRQYSAIARALRQPSIILGLCFKMFTFLWHFF